VALLGRLTPPLRTLGAAGVHEAGESGSDLRPLAGKVPLVAVAQDIEHYFDWHHTAADTFDKIDPLNLAIDSAAVAVVTYGLADAVETMPVGAPPKPF
jgi:carboxypeptidase Q